MTECLWSLSWEDTTTVKFYTYRTGCNYKTWKGNACSYQGISKYILLFVYIYNLVIGIFQEVFIVSIVILVECDKGKEPEIIIIF